MDYAGDRSGKNRSSAQKIPAKTRQDQIELSQIPEYFSVKSKTR